MKLWSLAAAFALGALTVLLLDHRRGRRLPIEQMRSGGEQGTQEPGDDASPPQAGQVPAGATLH